MNPFDGIAHFFLGLIQQKKLQAWFVLLFQLGFSAVVSFLYAAGAALVGGVPVAVAIGMGMVFSATAMTVVFRRSPATKGMTVALPADEAKTELDSPVQVITK